MAHKDGPLYRNKVLILSLGSSCVMKFRKEGGGESFQVFLEEDSGLLFSEEIYDRYLHEIEEKFEDLIGE